MVTPFLLADVLAPDRGARLVGDDIWSVLPADAPAPPYDGRARLYDRLIGSRLYNRLAWGVDPHTYTDFAREAARWGSGPLLDAGCGTLVSTAGVHAQSQRPTILLDLSIDMLGVARDRLRSVAGQSLQDVVFLQADVGDLPFRGDAFGAVLCPGMLHLFDDAEAITRELARVCHRDGRIHASSLVAERRIGRQYLSLLHRAGEVARPRRAADLLARLNGNGSGLAPPVDARRLGSMLFVTARPA
jgi:SAM-dependent methyltransferase